MPFHVKTTSEKDIVIVARVVMAMVAVSMPFHVKASLEEKVIVIATVVIVVGMWPSLVNGPSL